jgi:hypothetical protein
LRRSSMGHLLAAHAFAIAGKHTPDLLADRANDHRKMGNGVSVW